MRSLFDIGAIDGAQNADLDEQINDGNDIRGNTKSLRHFLRYRDYGDWIVWGGRASAGRPGRPHLQDIS